MSIVVKTVGGLGNQLFQYAFARAVSSHLKTDFSLDWMPFGTKYFDGHKYSLQHFNTKIKLAKATDMFGFVWFVRQYKFFELFYHYLRLKSRLLPFYYRERTFAYDPLVFSKDNSYFHGFWQTEKYFEAIRDELLKEITLIQPLSQYSKEVEDKIQSSDSISLHVRRADMVKDPHMAAFHGTCTVDYYNRAIELLSKSTFSPHFFVFSDDYTWSVEHFKFIKYPITFIKNGADKNYEDIILMSKCKHHIIANSSFSWWGAWLNPKKDRVVIAPKKWFANAPKTDTKDLIPDNWVRL